jgi:hypothetical protein
LRVDGSLAYDFLAEKEFEYEIQTSANLLDWMSMVILVSTNGVVRFSMQIRELRQCAYTVVYRNIDVADFEVTIAPRHQWINSLLSK